ncbi:MAG: ABC transporter permease, partial [Acidobacteriota bacterium]
MKFLRLLRKNLTRNFLRSFLTFSTIAVSLFLVATLMTALHELQNPPETPDSALRLIVRHRVSLFNSLPIAYRDKIRQIEGVEAVSGSMWFGGVYKDPSNFFAQFSVDTDQFFEIYPDILVPEDQVRAFKEDRTGALVGSQLLKR